MNISTVAPPVDNDIPQTCWLQDCPDVLEDASSSTTLTDAALLVFRLVITSLVLSHLVLFLLTHDYSLSNLQGLASLSLVFASMHLSQCSFVRVIACPCTASANLVAMLGAPLLQFSLTLVLFSAISYSAVHPPKRWSYPALAQIFIEPLMAAFLAASSQRLRFRAVYSLLPLLVIFSYYVLTALLFKMSFDVVLTYLNYKNMSHQAISATYLKLFWIAIGAAVLAYLIGNAQLAMNSIGQYIAKRKQDEDTEASWEASKTEQTTPVDEEVPADPDALVSWTSCEGRLSQSNHSDVSRRAPDGTNEHLPWFENKDESFGEPPDWVFVESEYGSKAVGDYKQV